MTYIRRSAWTSAPNAAPAIKGRQEHVTLHYPGFGSKSVKTAGWSVNQCLKQIKAWRAMHVPRSYKEIAYNLFALPTGDVVEGRGNRQNGANGSSTANREGMSIQVLIGDDEALTAGHLKAIYEALALLESWHPGITRTQYPHSHWVPTACPGPHVRAGIPYRVGPSGGPSVVKTSTPVRPAAASKPAPLAVDGKVGPATVRALQKVLGVTQDGKAGHATWKALQRRLGTPVDGVVSRQSRTARELSPLGAITQGWQYTGPGSRGSTMVRALQKKTGTTADGVWGPDTTRALQRWLNGGAK